MRLCAGAQGDMTGKISLAVLGAAPRFPALLPVGQFYWPDWDQYESAARGIFSRRYYTAQRFAGPLVVQLQQRLQAFLGVKHAVVVRNALNGLMIATHSLGLEGKVIVPSWAPAAVLEALAWSRCEPVFCDVDAESQQIAPAAVRRLLERGEIKGILGVHLWGNALPVLELEALAEEHGVALYYDASHAFGCRVDQKAVGCFGQAEVFSFHETNILSTGEGGCIVTNDDALASKFIAMRGDHVSGAGAAMQSATSRMSEIQAAVGLTMLDAFERNRRNNAEQRRLYESQLDSVPGIGILRPSGATASNFQHLVCVVDWATFGQSRDELLAVLRAENLAAGRDFHPPLHAIRPLRGPTAAGSCTLHYTELAAQSTLQLPIGARVTTDHIEQICDVIRQAQAHFASTRSASAAST
jgi:dTDP-4-amino-4,6-dideoxygalactose transaminase